MRSGILGIALMACASWGESISAQALTLGRGPSLQGQPSFQIRGFNAPSIFPLLVRKASSQRLKVAAMSVYLGTPLYTCPMPVAHTDSAKDDPMPVARGGTTEPMPVAKSGCSNPLGPSH
jgi:hypothetical protein